MKYIIMECHTSYAVLLDERGRFWKAANRQYEIGQTVEDPVLMKEPGVRKRAGLRAVMGIAAAAACFLLAFTGYYREYMILDTAICMTINPSVRMELNRKGRVINVAGVNEDGMALLEGYRPGSKDRLAVAEELIERAIEMGYLSAGGKIMLDIDAPEEAVFQKYGVEFRTGLAEYLTDTLEVEIQIVRHEDAAGEVPAAPEKETQPLEPVEIETEGIKPPEQTPEQESPDTAPKPSDTAPKTGNEQPRQNPAPGETPVHDGDSGHGSSHEDGSSGYGEGSNYGGSDYGEGSSYGGSGYGEGSNYGGSNYGEGSNYGSSGYGEGSNYDSPSDYE